MSFMFYKGIIKILPPQTLNAGSGNIEKHIFKELWMNKFLEGKWSRYLPNFPILSKYSRPIENIPGTNIII